MKRRCVLLTCHDAGGTVPPILALAESFVQRGHDVLILSQPSVRQRAEALGCTYFAFSQIPDYDRRTPLEEQLFVAHAMTGKPVGDDVIALVTQHGVDAVVVDANLAGALAATEQLGRPSAVLLHSMYKTYVDTWFADVWPILEQLINATRTAYGLEPVHSWPSVFAGHDRLFAVVPTVFDAPVAEVPDAMRHFGFLVPRRQSTGAAVGFPPGDDPAVLVGLSTTYQRQETLFETIVEALGDLAVRALVTTAGQVESADLPQPPNVAVTDFVPHTLVLDQTDAMVTHAGAGSVAGALSFGVPLVCIPLGRDQPLNAQRVVELGAGIALPEKSTAAEIASAVEQLLSTTSYRNAAGALAQASRDEGGAAAAAGELEAMLD